MSVISVNKASLSLGGKTLFENVSFSINSGDRIGLVGNNGSGKSSLLKCIVGQGDLRLNKGEIVKSKGAVIGYVSQDVPEEIVNKTCREFLLDSVPIELQDTNFWKVDIALSDLGFSQEDMDKPIGKLSGGWQRLLLIASATLKEPDVLILDEPTNHLDLGKIFHLERFLSENRQQLPPILMVSHDREFLDKCTDKTLFMRGDGVHSFSAPFSRARQELLIQDARDAEKFEQDQAEIARLQKTANRYADWARRSSQSSNGKKKRVVESRIEKIADTSKLGYSEQKRGIGLAYDRVSSKSVVSVSNLDVKTPDGRQLFRIDDFAVRPGDRICILGLNGTGKTMLLNRLVEESKRYVTGPGHEKKIWFSPQMQLGYLDQHLENLPGNISSFEFISIKYNLKKQDAIRHLASIGIPHSYQNIKIKMLSSGERSRLSLLALKLSKPNFLILDEPSNHLDISGQESLEEALDQDDLSCIFVSHDRTLIRGAATRYFEIKDGTLHEVDSPEPFFEMLERGDFEISALSGEAQHNMYCAV